MHGYLSTVFISAIDNDHWKVHLYIYICMQCFLKEGPSLK